MRDSRRQQDVEAKCSSRMRRHDHLHFFRRRVLACRGEHGSHRCRHAELLLIGELSHGVVARRSQSTEDVQEVPRASQTSPTGSGASGRQDRRERRHWPPVGQLVVEQFVLVGGLVSGLGGRQRHGLETDGAATFARARRRVGGEEASAVGTAISAL